jgi:hypothetical protein
MPTIHDADQFIVPLLQDCDRPGILGTTTFCAVEKHHFLVTAAHVLDEHESLYFGAGVIVGDCSTQVVRTSLPASGRREDDTIDVALLQLTTDQTRRLCEQGRRPIPIADWDPDDIAQPGQHYVFTGFPHSGTDRDRIRQVIEPRRVSADCVSQTDREIARLGLHPLTHIVGLFHRRRMQIRPGRMVMAPEPYGMSGGPVWTKRSNSDQLRWVGIGIEYRRKHRALIGTRLGAVIALMRAAYPDIAPLVRESCHRQFVVGR